MSESALRLHSLPSVKRPHAKRLGRGIGSGRGKTCGRGHKGQKSRSGGLHKVGFEGGQMPLQRRLPKFGFRSRIAATRSQLRLHQLASVEAEVIDKQALIAASLIPARARKVKVILSGSLTKPVTVRGLHFTAAARRALDDAGGRVID